MSNARHKRRPCGRVLALTVVGLSRAASGQELGDNGPSIYAGEAPGVILIRAAGVRGDDTMTAEVGTGFVIGPSGYVLTASHVIPEGEEYTSLILGGTFGPATANGKPYQLSLIRRSDSYDVALLQLLETPPNLTVLSLRNSTAKVGEKIFVLGYPLGLPDTHFLDGRVADVASDAITTNALVDRGNSGGPVLDANGCVIGIVFGEITSLEGQPVNGIKFAVPIKSLSDFLPTDLVRSTQAQPSTPDSAVIHVSDSISRTQTDHQLTETIRAYHDVIPARDGFVVEAIEAVGQNSLNPPSLQFPVPVISADRRSIIFDYSLSSGPFYDQRRGWIDMTINTRQRRIGTSPGSMTGTCE